MSWGASNNGQNFGLEINNGVSNSSSAVSMFAVVAGSYSLPGSFGSGALPVIFAGPPPVSTAALVQDEAHSALVIRKEDSQIDFTIKITLNILDDIDVFPGGTTEEIRIGTKITNFPVSPIRMPQSAVLNPVNYQAYFPLFADVEVLQRSGLPLAVNFPASAGGLGQLKARFLNGGQLALVNVDYTALNTIATTPVLASDINALAAGADSTVVFSIRGSYLTKSPGA